MRGHEGHCIVSAMDDTLIRISEKWNYVTRKFEMELYLPFHHQIQYLNELFLLQILCLPLHSTCNLLTSQGWCISARLAEDLMSLHHRNAEEVTPCHQLERMTKI